MTGASLVCFLGEVADPRKPSNGTRHDFLEILVIAISAVLSDCDTIEDMAEWGRTKEAWRREFLVLRNGVPSEKTFLRIFQALDPKQFEAASRRWVGALRGVVAVDGKTVRGSGSGGESAIHMVSAFTTELGVVLGQEKIARQSNEITAIPELLKALSINGWLVSIDAMGCQKSFARQITDQGGDDRLAVKDNQPTLSKAIKTEFIDPYQSEAVDRNRQVSRPMVDSSARSLRCCRRQASSIWPIGPRARRSVWSTPSGRWVTRNPTWSSATTSVLVS